MRVRIEIEEGLEEEEVIIRCGRLNDSVVSLQNYISRQEGSGGAFHGKGSFHGKSCLFLKNAETEFYIPIEEIYFFETEGRQMRAHTADRIFTCEYRLYELEELLPGSFMRISKSSIANLDLAYSITRNLTASSVMEFRGSAKKAFVSRAYFKAVTDRLKARKLGL